MTFPVIQSVLDPAALAAEVQSRYELAGPVHCRLVSRGMNDIYAVDHAAGRYALKVSRADKGSDADLEWELGYVRALDAAGFPVATPVTCADGSGFLALPAPEGRRQVVLMVWLDGEALSRDLDAGTGYRLGVQLAKMHLATLSYVSAAPKQVAAGRKMLQRLPLLLKLLPAGSVDRAFLERAAPATVAAADALQPGALPWGPCHGDMQYANAMLTPAGELAIFDFSDCGEDYLARDLAAFYWRNDYDGVAQAINDAFLRGYQTVRPLNAAEQEAQPLFRAMRHLVITAAMAEFVDRIGPVPGFDKNLSDYVAMIRRHCNAAGIR
jgi:Ser/Thr protein kinase RdoA (MazF antagonist)